MDYQELFNYMANNHNVNLLESEMQEVISIVQRMLNNSEATVETPSVNDNEGKKEELLCSLSYDIWTNCEAYNTEFCRECCDYRAK